MLKVSKYVTGVVQTNVYFCYDDETRACVIIDPAANAPHIIKIIEEELHLKPEAILLTHGHFDHIMAAKDVAQHFGIKIFACADEAETLADPKRNLSGNFGVEVTLQPGEYETFRDGDTLHHLGREWKVVETPGHTPGSCCFYIADGLSFQPEGATEPKIYPVLFSGDTLFKESFGRTDFTGGSQEAIVKSIVEKLLVLPADTSVFPGHEAQSSIGNEQKYNPAVFLGRVNL